MSYRTIWVLLLFGLAAGCQDRTADQLLGRWIGQPDTSAKQAMREASRYQDLALFMKNKGYVKNKGPIQTQASVQSENRLVEAQPSADSQHDTLSTTSDLGNLLSIDETDWEQYEVKILLEFGPKQQVSMSLANGSEPRSGIWRVVRETPIGVVIEIETSRSEPLSNQETSAKGDVSTERRRFELQLDLDDQANSSQPCVGFRLIELGADPRLGAIYFQREKSN